MIQHYKALIRKLINEKSTDRDYFIKYIPLTLDHMIGNHQACDSFFCYGDYLFHKIEISQEAVKELRDYLTKMTYRVDRIKEGVTSNLAEAFFSVACKFDHGKIKNFIQGNNYRLRSFCAALSFNEGPTWNYNILKSYLGIDSGSSSKIL